MSPSPTFLDPDTPNPFAMGMASANPTVLQRVWRGTKTVILTLLVTVLLLLCVYFGKHWLLNQLVGGLDGLDPAEKQTRLIQIASFGDAAIDPLTDRLIDADDSVSESAFVLLQKMQNDWITLGQVASIQSHQRLFDSIEQTYREAIQLSPQASPLTDKQIARGRELLNQTVLEFAELNSSDANEAMKVEASKLVGSANRLLEELRGNYSTAGSAKLANAEPKLQNRAGWTDWPRKPDPGQAPGPRYVLDGDQPTSKPVETAHRLQALPDGVTVPLTQIVSAARKPKVLAAKLVAGPRTGDRPDAAEMPGPPADPSSGLQMTTHLTESPLAVLDDETVIRHLANPDAIVSRQAQTELMQRGFTSGQVEMAKSIANARPDDRIRLLDSLVHSSQFNSGPWLSMLLDDPDRKVRMHVVSTLEAGFANFRDPALLKLLQNRLDREKDWHVAWRIRKTLEQR